MKLKKALMLSMLALGAVGVASCGKKDDENNDNSSSKIAEVEQKNLEARIASAKVDLDSYVSGLLETAEIETFTSLQQIVTEKKNDIDSKESIAAVDAALESAKTAISAEINRNKPILLARKDAKAELNAYITAKKYLAGFESSATAFDSLKTAVESKIAAASTKADLQSILYQAKNDVVAICEEKASTDLASAVDAAKTAIEEYATAALTAAGVEDTNNTIKAIKDNLTASLADATFEKEVTLLTNASKIDIDFAVDVYIVADLADERTAAAEAYDTYVTENIGTKVDDGSVAAKVLELKAKLLSYRTAADITAAVEAGKVEIKATIDAIMTAEQVATYKTTKKTELTAYATALGFTNAAANYATVMTELEATIDAVNVKLAIDQAFNSCKVSLYNMIEDESEKDVTYVNIATVADFQKMQADLVAAEELTDTEKAAVLATNYRLVADIDMKDVKITEGSNIQNYTGTFDGNGHAIKNYNIVDATANKRGLLFRSTKNATIKNLTFINCSHVGAQEGIALITGEATTTTFKNLEFNGCTVDAGSKSYAGLLIGRNTRNGVTVDGITVKGNSYTSANYGGGLIGDARDLGTGNAIFKNLDIDMTMNVVGNTGGLLAGRTDTDKFTATVENARINVNITGSSTKASALFDGASKGATYTFKNVVISGSTRGSVTSDIVVGNGAIVDSITATNVYVVSDATAAKYNTLTGVKTVESAGLTEAFYKELVFGDAWVYENGDARLQYASSNVIPSDATVESISVITTLAKTRYKIGEAFDKNGLAVTAKYLLSNGTTMERTLDSYEYEVACASFNNKVAGKYNATVSFGGASVDYEVSVVEIESIELVLNEATQIFTDITKFDSTGLVVKTQYSDGVAEKLSEDNFEIDLLGLDSEPGAYTVEVKTGENGKVFTAKYDIAIADLMVLDAASKVISVNVDSLAKTSTVEDGFAVFSSIKDALDYLESLELSADIEKVVNIAAGEYEEKIVVNDANVTFVGAVDKDGNPATEITFGMASGHNTFNLAGTWGTDKSATALIYGKSFAAKNIQFTNSFDYFNDKTAGSNTQALAIGVYADEAIFYNCGFSGYQDTIQTKNGRQYFYDCYIEGCVDYIFGVDCTTFFKNCEIKSLDRKPSNDNNGYVVAPKTAEAYTYGFYFDGCKFTAEETVKTGSMALARPWGATGTCVIVNSEISAAYSVAAYGNADKVQPRYADMSGNKPADANFFEYNNTGAGAITAEVAGMKFYTADQAAKVNSTDLFVAGEVGSITFTAWNAEADLTALKNK